ncbi:MAG: hypothetical protein JJE09_12190 [Bacteroidia bacterium]|nr:hypothetical protein [Bacteroidia bacterium]
MWRNLSGNAKFSIIAFLLTMALGLLSMGALGYGLYFLVSPFLEKDLDSLRGDITWPTVLIVGMLSSIGFLFAGVVFRFLRFRIKELASYLVYAIILWAWVLLLWYVFLNFSIIQ